MCWLCQRWVVVHWQCTVCSSTAASWRTTSFVCSSTVSLQHPPRSSLICTIPFFLSLCDCRNRIETNGQFAAIDSASKDVFTPRFYQPKPIKSLARFEFKIESCLAISVLEILYSFKLQVLFGITDDELYILDEFEDIEYERDNVNVFLTVSCFILFYINIWFNTRCRDVYVCFFLWSNRIAQRNLKQRHTSGPTKMILICTVHGTSKWVMS